MLPPADDGTTLPVPADTPLLVVVGQNGSGDRVAVLGDAPRRCPDDLPGAATPQGRSGSVPGPCGSPVTPMVGR